MSDADKRYYDRKALYDEKRRMILDKAKARGEAAKKWLEQNKLTPQTQKEFNAVMRKANKDFDNPTNQE